MINGGETAGRFARVVLGSHGCTPEFAESILSGCSIMICDLSGIGMLGLAFAAPLLGSLLAMGMSGGMRGRFTACVVGGTVAGACLWFVNFFLYENYTGVTMGGPPSGPFSEAMYGCIPGAIVGLVVGIAASENRRSIRLRFTVREMTMVVALSALVLFLLVNFIEADRGVRLLMVVVAAGVSIPMLVIVDLRGENAGLAGPISPGNDTLR